MSKRNQCPHCGHNHLLRIGVRGIKKCAKCDSFVDVRSRRNWLKHILSA